MKWRYGFLLCCAVLIALAGATVASGREVALLCCESSAGCPGEKVCCDPDGIGLDPCDEGTLVGYCMERCTRVAGASTFTADQR